MAERTSIKVGRKSKETDTRRNCCVCSKVIDLGLMGERAQEVTLYTDNWDGFSKSTVLRKKIVIQNQALFVLAFMNFY